MYKDKVMTRLLISVRSVAEASLCIHNGADMIDIKEPSRGSLGMSSPETICAITREVPPRIPVSAALGEWMDWRRENRYPHLPAGVTFLKMGLAGAGSLESWREEFGRFCHELCGREEIYSQPSWMAVAYADWKQAGAPPPEEVLDFAVANGFSTFLLDTWCKNGKSLFDHMSVEMIARLAGTARLRDLQVALAGSSRQSDLDRLLALEPDIVVIRTAFCQGASQEGTFQEGAIDTGAIRDLAGKISSASPASHALV